MGMDLNGIKSRVQKVKAPKTGSGAWVHTSNSLDQLTARLQAADHRERGRFRKAAPFFAIAAVLFFVSVVTTWLLPTFPPAGEVVFRTVMFSMYLLLTVGLLWRSRQLAQVDYAAPMGQFLEVAERRYRFMRPWDYLVIVAGCVLIGTVTGTHVIKSIMDRNFGPEHLTLIIICYCVFFVGLCVMGLVFTYKNWKREKRQLWLEIRQILAELDAEETDSVSNDQHGS